MNVLLDTHAFLWWVTGDARLSSLAQQIFSDIGNTLFLSAASAWEIAIKAQLGKLQLLDTPERVITKHMTLNAIQAWPILIHHSLHTYTLPLHHRDPFDRILIAQSQVDNMPLLTADPLIAQYPMQTLW